MYSELSFLLFSCQPEYICCFGLLSSALLCFLPAVPVCVRDCVFMPVLHCYECADLEAWSLSLFPFPSASLFSFSLLGVFASVILSLSLFLVTHARLSYNCDHLFPKTYIYICVGS